MEGVGKGNGGDPLICTVPSQEAPLARMPS